MQKVKVSNVCLNLSLLLYFELFNLPYMRLFLLMVMVLFFHVASMAQKGEVYHKNQYNKKHGLVQDGIHSLYQSKSGILWVGTQDGLHAFNGHRFEPISFTGMDKFVIAIAEDSKGNIWFCSRDRLAYYNQQEETVTITHARWKDFPSMARFYHVGKDLYAFLGGILIKCETGACSQKSFLYDDVVQIEEGFCGVKNGVVSFSKSLWNFQSVKKLTISPYTIPSQAGGKELLCQYNDSLFAFDFGLNRRFIGVFAEKIIQANWVQHKFLLILSNRSVTWYKERSLQIGETKNSQFNVMFHASNQQIYVGTTGDGLLAFKPLPFAHTIAHTPSNRKGLCSAICETHEGVWVKFSGAYYLLKGKKEMSLFKLNDLFQQKNILGLKKIQNGNYCAYGKKGMMILSPKFEVLFELPEPSEGVSFYHACSIEGGVLLGAGDGAYIWQFHSPRVLNKLPQSEGFCTSTLYLKESKQFVVSSLKELMVFDENKNKIRSFLKPLNEGDKAIFPSVLVQTEKGIYMGTLGNGIKFLDNHLDSVTHVAAHGEHIFGMIYKGNYLWFSTLNGIYRWHLKEDKIEHVLYKEELPGELYQNSYELSKDGKLLFGGTEAWVAIDENYIQNEQPRLYAASWLIGSSKGIVGERIGEQGVLNLQSNEKDIRLQVGLLSSNPEGYGLRYKLYGYNNEWQNLLVDYPFINYTNLPYGAHKLEVELYSLIQPDKILDVLEVPIFHALPFYLTWWFLSIMVMLIITLVIASVRYVSQRKLKQQLEAAYRLQLVQAEKTAISRELHDNVGAQVTYLTKSMENLAFKYHREGEANLSDLFKQMAAQSRMVMNQLRDSIWAVRTEKIICSEMFLRLVNFSQKANEHTGFEVKVENLLQTDLVLNPHLGLNLFRVLQEGVTNALKHSACNQIFIGVYEQGEKVLFIVRDNGKGLMAKDNEGFGLENIHARAKESSFHVEFVEPNGGGTELRVLLERNKSNVV